MKVTYNWLKDFVDIKIAPRALADKLTMAGLEVVSLEEKEGDWIFEIEITSNRPDWLSVMGIAREVAALTNIKLQTPNSKLLTKPQNVKSNINFKIEIENKTDCPLYTARIIRDVQVKSSPEWMKKRLELVGIRPVNNIVDITNYILLETGEPLHAFDLDKLKQKQELEIIVRRAKAGEKIITIDGKERPLDKDILVIADSAKPVAVAGIIGGKDSEVSESTKNILLEAAKFSAVLIRKGRQKLGLSTESSYRFERDVDIEAVNLASLRAEELILKEARGRKVLFIVEPKLSPAKTKTVSLKREKMDTILGVAIPNAKIKNILENLGLKVKITKAAINASIPSFRRDLSKDVDLIEEICRIHGYEQIPTTTPSVVAQRIETNEYDLNLLVRDILISQGLYEAITHSLVNAEFLSRSLIQEEGIALANPLSKELEILRPTLLPSLLNCIAYNFNRKQELIQVFEIAKKFVQGEDEEYLLSIGLAGVKQSCDFTGKHEEKISIFNLKGALEVLMERLGVADFEFSQDQQSVFKDGACFVLKIGGKVFGVFGEARQEALDAADIKNRQAFLAELYLSKLHKVINLDRCYKALPNYPAITRDISVVVASDIAVNDLISSVEEFGAPCIKEVKIADFYKGEHIPKGSKGLTFSCIYQSDARTLQDSEVNALHNKILESLKEKFHAQIR